MFCSTGRSNQLNYVPLKEWVRLESNQYFPVSTEIVHVNTMSMPKLQ